MNPLLIFDCDGTLVDSEPLCSLAWSQELSLHGITYSSDELLSLYKGWKFKTIQAEVEDKHNYALPQDFESTYRERLKQLFEEQLQAIPEVANALAQLPHAKCVASSGPKQKILQSLTLTGLITHFKDRLFSAYDVGSWKPEPDLFLCAAEQMCAQPEQCIVIEDSTVGAEAAHRAGMQALLYDPDNSVRVDAAWRATKFQCMTKLPQLIQSLAP